MKTAVEYAVEYAESNRQMANLVNVIKEAQLDAYKAGMTEAASMAEGWGPHDIYLYIARSIRTARDNKTAL